VVLIPVFEDPEEQKLSPYRNEDWYDERMSWKWMNTVMRVNSLVQKVCHTTCHTTCPTT
jgi:tRNA-splicing endonuclease subunit Sen2